MVDNNYKFQKSPELEQRSISKYRQAPPGKVKKTSLKQRILPAGILIFLATWIGLCVNNNGYLLDKALIGSAIISGLLCLKAAEQNSDWSKNN